MDAHGEAEFGDDEEAKAKADAMVDEALAADSVARDVMMATPLGRLADLTFKVDKSIASLR